MISVVVAVNITESATIAHIASDKRYSVDRMLVEYLLKLQKVLQWPTKTQNNQLQLEVINHLIDVRKTDQNFV